MILQLLNGIQRYQYGVSKPHDRISVLVYSSLIFMVYLVSQNEVETANGLGFEGNMMVELVGCVFFCSVARHLVFRAPSSPSRTLPLDAVPPVIF